MIDNREAARELAAACKRQRVAMDQIRCIDIEGGQIVVTLDNLQRRVLTDAPEWLVRHLCRDGCRVKEKK